MIQISENGIAFVVIVAFVAMIATMVLRSMRNDFVLFEYQRGLLFKNGKLLRLLDSGKTRVWGKGYTMHALDIRPVITPVGNQEILTKDGLAVKITATIRYQVADPIKAIMLSQSYMIDAYQSIQIAMRDAISELIADEVVTQRRDVAARVTEANKPKFESIGLKLDEVEFRDIAFPGELRKAMAQVALAQKEGLASLERARGEAAALRTLANAARLIEGNPALMQLRTLQSIGEAKSATIVLNASDRPVLPVATNAS